MKADTTTPVPERDPLRSVTFYGARLPQRVVIHYNTEEEQRKENFLRANRGVPLTDTTTGLSCQTDMVATGCLE